MRMGVTSAFAAATAMFAFAAGLGLTGSGVAATVIAFAAAAGAWWVGKRALLALDPSACPRWLAVASGVATVLALAQVGRLTVFMVDASRTSYSFMPSSVWEREHSCLSAYHVASEESSTGDIYDNALYSAPDDNPTQPRKARMIGTFKIDVFEYPPPFLLLPRALHFLTPEFLELRMLWFALSGGLLLLGQAAVARFLGAAAGTRALLLSPFVWLALTTMSTLQKGNVQVMIVVLSILAMLLFERRNPAAGGALLAFATASKLYPGLLVVYLLVRRQWRAVAWTAAWGAAFSLLTLAAFGWAPYGAFLDHLPRLLSGEAFPAFRNPRAMAINMSIPGLLYKATIFGFTGASFDRMRAIGTLWMLLSVALIVYVGLRRIRDADKPLVWIAILILATFRSPFLPQAYGTLPPLWLLMLVVAVGARRSRDLVAAAAGWLVLSFNWPVDRPIGLPLLAAISLVQMGVTSALVVLALRSRPNAGQGDLA